jgi:hypothetical protein
MLRDVTGASAAICGSFGTLAWTVGFSSWLYGFGLCFGLGFSHRQRDNGLAKPSYIRLITLHRPNGNISFTTAAAPVTVLFALW